jgi:hypothetical protein
MAVPVWPRGRSWHSRFTYSYGDIFLSQHCPAGTRHKRYSILINILCNPGMSSACGQGDVISGTPVFLFIFAGLGLVTGTLTERWWLHVASGHHVR